MRRLPFLSLWLLLCGLVAFCGFGCSSDPVTAAAEVRAVLKETQFQVGEQKDDLEHKCATGQIAVAECKKEKAKIADTEAKLAQADTFVSALEVAAANADKDPTKWVNFQALYVEWKPKVEAMAIHILITKYLGG